METEAGLKSRVRENRTHGSVRGSRQAFHKINLERSVETVYSTDTMIPYAAHIITEYLYRNKFIQKECEVYEFGISLLIPYWIECFFVLLIAFFRYSLFSGCVYILLFSNLRKITGGYHAHSYVGCMISYVILFILICELSRFLDFGLIFIGFVVSSIGCFIISPVSHPNKRQLFLSKADCRKKLTVFNALECLLFIMITILTRSTMLVAIGMLTHTFVWILAMLQMIQNKKGG